MIRKIVSLSPPLDSKSMLRASPTFLLAGALMVGFLFQNPIQQAYAGGAGSKTSPVLPMLPEMTAQERTPAVFDDPTGRNQFLTRLEFEELGLKMVGMATFNGKRSVFLQQPGPHQEMIYTEGDVIGGFTVDSIKSDQVIFERNGARLWVYLGGTSPAASAASLQESVEVVEAGLASKLSREGIKVMLKAYEDIKTYPVLPPEAYRVVKAAKPPKVLERVVASRNRHRFILPLGGKITSRYGYRQAPMGGARRYHRGVDIAGPAGSAIRSAGEGEVLKVTRSLYEGLHVILQHADRFQTAYFHLSKASVKKGQWIKQGQVIGYEGSSGLSTGPHLHFEVRKNGQPVDPSFYIEELNRR